MNKKIIITALAVTILYVVLAVTSGFFLDYEWFRINDALQIFWVLFLTKFNVHVLFSGAFIALFALNFLLIRILGGSGRIFTSAILSRFSLPVLGTPRRALFIIMSAGVIVVGFMMGGAASSFWKEYLMFKNSVPFTGFPADPIFNNDIGFYVFSLPFYQFLYNWLMSALAVVLAFSAVFHLVNGGILVRDGRIDFSLFARAHLSSLLALIVLLYGVGYRLSAFNLLHEKIGKIYGAGYTAIHANLVAYNVAMVIAFIGAALLLFNIFKRSFRLPVAVLALLLPIFFVLGTVWPAILQRFVVEPNELDNEKPYIERNIKFTRLAYRIDSVREVPFADRKNLTLRDIEKNRSTIDNIRLWDWRPLKQTYKQLQELKPYYFFNDVDVDRYVIDGKKTAVNLSARELSIDGMSKNTQTWQNRHLIFTHGYGAVMSRVDRITSEGLPEFMISDIPPQSSVPIRIDRPEIYYGEHKNSYVITNTDIKPGEFDYPSGKVNKSTTYRGTGGVKVGSFFKRILFAAAFRDLNMLISGSISSESRILFKRNIMEMAQDLTPFLEFDDDPYLVIEDGKFFWIIDAYTMSDRFPYSSPILTEKRKINYIRNPVKVVIDAYNGTIRYYIIDETDPIIKAYASMFPGFFKKIADMPDGLKSHVRYPEELFNIQSRILLSYHMTNPTVFYNNEDAWALPRQKYENTEVDLHSYYFITTLPDETESQFILVLPFTPYKRKNMISFLVARCDAPGYGELKLYLLPKDRLTYGPMQVEARIDQDPEISKQLTLWAQKGSGVIRGNMMAIPIGESMLYVEPLYLRAENSEMPELKRVIVAYSDKIVMEKDLQTSLERLFSGAIFSDSASPGQSAESRLRELAAQASHYYTQAESSLREGNWTQYGESLKRLKETLQRMQGTGR